MADLAQIFDNSVCCQFAGQVEIGNPEGLVGPLPGLRKYPESGQYGSGHFGRLFTAGMKSYGEGPAGDRPFRVPGNPLDG